MQDFSGKTAVITGGASGIGFGLATTFAGEGMNVVIGDVEKDALDGAVAKLAASGANVEGIVTDVTVPEQMQALADGAVARFGGVHVFCNNAGVGGGGLSWEQPLETWEWVLGVNLWGVIHGLRSFVPLLMQQDAAHIVNTASLAGLVSAPFMSAYNASKHAVVAISETLFHELAMTAPQVHVSVLCPGWVATNIGDADRNRPSHLRVETQEGMEAAGRDALKGVLANGMPPEKLAAKVLDAIREERFWILSHDGEDGDMWTEAVNRKLRSIEGRTNPQFSFGL